MAAAEEEEVVVHEEVGRMVTYNIEIDAWGEGLESVDKNSLNELPGLLNDMGAIDAVGAFGGITNGPGATFGVAIDDPSDALNFGLEVFTTACEKLGINHGGIARMAVFTEDYLERLVDQEPETYVGVTEIAGILGVSRQRVSELRTSAAFPAPVAELAAGPVWMRSSLNRFIDGWKRKPGRPRKKENRSTAAAAAFKEKVRAAARDESTRTPA
jgi:hypothetical protein